ncbi:MAG TPA: hypothetical protein VGG20_09545 [Thermoanaerobaculia bacterium]|jgi:hypothetical protein
MATPTTDLDRKINQTSGPGHGNEQQGVALGDFDREINLRAILWSGVWLVVVTLVSALLMWWMMKGFAGYDRTHEVKLMPMEAKYPSPKLPASTPLLQPEDPRQDRNQDMYDLRAAEDKLLDRAGWVDQPGGTLRISVDEAIDAIVQRGVAPFPATGAAATPATPAKTPPLPAATPSPAKPLG